MIIHHPAPGHDETAYERAIGAPAVPGPYPGPARQVAPPWPQGGPTPQPAPGPPPAAPAPGAPSPQPSPQPQPTPNPRPGPGSVSGQAIVGQPITSAWWQGSYEITQGYGATDFEREPSGHGAAHWHAGVDVGVPCGTTISLPAGIDQATVSAIDNPGGYGTALVVHLQGFDVWLGHLRQRLVTDGATVKAHDQLAISNNTGNSTGCHIHFEVRKTGGTSPTDNGQYGSDVDPTELLTAGVDTQVNLNPLDALTAQLRQELATAEQSVSNLVIHGGQVLLGTGLTMGGLLLAAYGLRGGTVAQAASMARGAAGRLSGRSSPSRPPSARQGPRRLPRRAAAAPSSGTGVTSDTTSGVAASVPRGTGPVERAAEATRRRAAVRQAQPARAGDAMALQRRALRQEIRAAQAARRAAGPGGNGWVDATVRLNMARNKLSAMGTAPSRAAATRVRR